MKKIWIIPFSVLALSLASCEKTEIIQNQGNEENVNEEGFVKVSFEATTPGWSSDSRTSLEEGNKVFWHNGDRVRMISNSGMGYDIWSSFYAQMSDDKAPTASLIGYAPIEASEHFLFYPSNCINRTTGFNLYYKIPTNQDAVAGTFARSTNPSWAYTNKIGESVQFHNAAALLKFSLSGDCKDISCITLTSNKEESPLTGDFYFDVQDPSNITINISNVYDAKCFPSAKLIGNFTSGNTYYFVISPIGRPLENGFKLTFEKTDGTKYVKKAKAGVINELYSGRIANIGDINLDGAEFTNDILDEKFIDAIESACNINWTKEEDGRVALTPENLNAIQSITTLDISDKGLVDLSYLKYFTGLEELHCYNNSITELDLNDLHNLSYLNVSGNVLKSLKIDKLTKLTVLICSDNQLEELDLANLVNLRNLNFSNNLITNLNVDNQTELLYLACEYNPIQVLNLSNLKNLLYLYCSGIPVTELNLSNQTNLIELNCNSTMISELDVNGLTNLKKLSCSYIGELTSLNVDNLTELQSLSFDRCPIEYVNFSNLRNLLNLSCTNTKLSQLDLSECVNLSSLSCQNLSNFNGVLDLSKNTELAFLYCFNSNIYSLDLSNSNKLRYLYCSDNKLTELNLEKCISLSGIECMNQNIGEGNKLQLYLNIAQESVWEQMAPTHSATVDVHFDNSVVSDNDHGSFNESDYTGVLN